MKTPKPAALAMRLIAGFAVLLSGGQVVAQDAWLRGQALFNEADKCIDCHTSSAKSGSTFDAINDAINGGPGTAQPCMNGTAVSGCASPTGAARNLTGLSPANISDIATYLSTPKHASLTPSTHDFGGVAVNASSNPTHTFTLTSDGDDSRADSSVTFTGTTSNSNGNFSVNASACTGSLAVGSPACNVIVTFDPGTVQALPFVTQFGVDHDGFGGTSTAGARGTGAKDLELTASLFPFTATAPVTSAAQTVTIANRLDSTVRLCLLDATTFSAPGDFNLVGRTYDAGPERCATVAPPVGNQGITFTPTADGPRLARFTAQRVSGGVLVGPVESVALEGNVGPFMSVTANTLFAGVRQDVNAGAAAPSVVALSNAGNETLRVSSISIPLVVGAGSAEYAASGCAAGTLLNVSGPPCDLSVTFDPIDIGTRATALLIGYSDAADTPASRRTVSIDLRGQGTRGASLVVRNDGGVEIASGSSETFGLQNINIGYRRQITLSNIGSDESLAVSAGAIAPASSGFDLVAPAIAGACPTITTGFTLTAGASCVVDLRFSPIAVTPYSASLSLPSRPAGAVTAPINFVLNLSGEGVDGRPVLQWQTVGGSPLSLLEVPGITGVGSTTPPQVNLRLANPGPGAAALQLLNLIGTDASSFAIGPAAPGRCDFGATAAPLLPGTSCEVVITFQPQTAGAKTSNLQLVSTGTTPAPLEIRGQASGPAATIALTALPLSMNLNQVRVGAQSAPAAVTLANDGTLAAVVTAIEASAGFVVETGSCGAVPFTVQPRASCALALRFAPSSSGTASGSLRVQVSSVAAPIEVALEGMGTAQADVSGGGCSIIDGRSPTDPTLWTLLLLAALALVSRRRRRAVRRAGPEDGS